MKVYIIKENDEEYYVCRTNTSQLIIPQGKVVCVGFEVCAYSKKNYFSVKSGSWKRKSLLIV